MTHLEIKRRIVGTRRDGLVTLPSGDLYDVIALYEATAEREAKLRKVLDDAATELKLALEVNDDMPLSLYGVRDDLFAALKKGGG